MALRQARVESQSFRLTLDEKVNVEYLTKYIAGVQQKYTQSGGVRPFGISTLIVGATACPAKSCHEGPRSFRSQHTRQGGRLTLSNAHVLRVMPMTGFDSMGQPCLYQTDPSGTYSAWKANAIGRNSKVTPEYKGVSENRPMAASQTQGKTCERCAYPRRCESFWRRITRRRAARRQSNWPSSRSWKPWRLAPRT